MNVFEARRAEFEFNFFVFRKYKLSYLLLDERNLSKKSIYHNSHKDRVSYLVKEIETLERQLSSFLNPFAKLCSCRKQYIPR